MEENNNLQNGIQEPVTLQVANNPEVTNISQESIDMQTTSNLSDENNLGNQDKKEKGIVNTILHMSASFIVWNYVILTLFNMVIQSILTKFFSDSVNMIIIGYNSLWILTSVISVFLTYYINRKRIIEEKHSKLSKNVMLGVFVLFIMLINYRNLLVHMEYGLVVAIIMILIHVFVLWILNCKLHEKFFNSKIEKSDYVSLTIFIVVLFVVLLVSNTILNKKYTLNCVRGNGDNVVIKFDTDGIKSVSVNDKELESDELMIYRLKFVGKFAMAQIGSDDVDELVDEYMEIVSNYEENDEEYKSTCSYK